MTINTTIRKAGPFIGNGGTTVFPFSFKVFEPGDLLVVRLNVSTTIETTLVLNSDYTVTLNLDQDSNPGGSIALIAGPLATGFNLIVTSDIPDTQQVDLSNQGGFYPEVINDALDRATIQIQQLQEEVDRSIKVPVTEPVTVAELTADLIIVADHVDNVDTVANHIANVDRVATSANNVDRVAASANNVDTVAAHANNVDTVAGHIANVDRVATSADAVDIVAADLSEPVSEIEVVANNITSVNTVGTNIASVNTTAASIANVNTVADDLNEPVSEINTVAANIVNVNNVGNDITNVNAVSAHLGNIDTVAPHVSNVDTVASSIGNVNTVATNIANVNTVATNIASVNAAYSNATNAAASAAAAATARDIAQNSSRIYATTAAGIAATTNGQYFYVPKGSPNSTILDLYQNNSGTASYINSIPGVGFVENFTENLSGPTSQIIGSDHPIALTRGDYTAKGNDPSPTIFGWGSAFYHNGSAFNVVQINMRANGNGRFKVEILRSNMTTVVAYGFVEVSTTWRICTVMLNRTVRDLANNEVAYIRYYDPNQVLAASYPSGGARSGSDPSGTTYPDYYWVASYSWNSIAPNYRIDFRVLDVATETRNFANEITALQAAVPSTVNDSMAGVAYSKRAEFQLAFDPTKATPNLTRGDYTQTSGTVNAALCGWMSPFTHNGQPFNVVQLSFITNGSTTKQINVEIVASNATTILATGSIFTNGVTGAATYYVELSRMITEIANGTVLYVRYYEPTGTVGLSYPAGGTYVSPDPTPGTGSGHYEYYFLGSTKTWGIATPYGNYRIQFRTFNTLTDFPWNGNAAALNATREIRNGVIPYITWNSGGGVGEMDGDADYGYPGAMGFYEYCSEPTFVTATKWRFWKSSPVDFEWRAYIRDDTTAFNMESTPRVAQGSIAAANVPTSNNIVKISFGSRIFVPKGKYLYVILKPINDAAFNIRRWTTSNAYRHGFVLNVSGGGWNATFGYGSGAYLQSAPQFLNESDEFQSASIPNPVASAIAFSPTAGIASTNVQTAIAELANTEIVLPATVYGVQGKESNVYYDNLFLDDADNYNISAVHSAGSGTAQNHRWVWNPSGAVTSGTLEITASHKNTGLTITSKTTNTRAAAVSAGTGTTKKVIVVGDSLIAAGDVTQTLVSNATGDPMGVTLYGTLGSGANKHEGRGGWSVYDYTGVGRIDNPNPFWNFGTSQLDFANYLSVNGFPAPDWVFIELGINDQAGTSTDADALSNANTRQTALISLINSIKAANAGTKVGLMIPTPPSFYQDSFGANYGAISLRRWRFKRSILIWARQMLANFAGQEASRVYLVPSNVNLDTVYNMVWTTAYANARNTTLVQRQGNGVHPATSGYQQMGDAVWAFMKYYA